MLELIAMGLLGIVGTGAALIWGSKWSRVAEVRADELARLNLQYAARERRIRLLEAQDAAVKVQRAGALAKANAANRAKAAAKRVAGIPA